MESKKAPPIPQTESPVTRRTFGGKLVYIPPAVLAVINASERPALAQSGGSGPPPQ